MDKRNMGNQVVPFFSEAQILLGRSILFLLEYVVRPVAFRTSGRGRHGADDCANHRPRHYARC